MAEFKPDDMIVEEEEKKGRVQSWRKIFQPPYTYMVGGVVLALLVGVFWLGSGKQEVVIKSGGDIVETQFKRFEESYKEINKKIIEELEGLRKEVEGLKEEVKRRKAEEPAAAEKPPVKVELPSYPSGEKQEPLPMPTIPPPPEEEMTPIPGWKEVKVRKISVDPVGVRYMIKKKAEKKDKPKVLYLPAGSVLKVASIGQITAPVVVPSQTGLPVALFKVRDVVLPNGRRSPLKGCFVVGKPIGNWNRSRVDVQAVALTCTTPEGFMEARINGWVKGEDEDDGLVGKVEYARGKEIAFYFSSVFLRGFASAMAQAQTQQQTFVSPQGTTQATVVQNAFSYAMWKSIEESIKAITDFYIQNADQLFPVVKAHPQTAYIILANTAKLEEVRSEG